MNTLKAEAETSMNPTMIAYGIYTMTINLTKSGCVIPNLLLFRIFGNSRDDGNLVLTKGALVSGSKLVRLEAMTSSSWRRRYNDKLHTNVQ